MSEDIERRKINIELYSKVDMLVEKLDDISNVIHAMKGKQTVLEQYLQVKFGGKDLVGTAMEGNMTRELREIHEKITLQNGRVFKNEVRIVNLEYFRWFIAGGITLATFIITMVVTYHK